jgi:hypothetical protein
MSLEDRLAEVDQLPPGPDLGDALSEVDPRALNGTQLVDLIVARQRQLCFEQAQLLVAVRELAYSPADAVGATTTVRDTSQDPYARMELAFALTWTEYRAADLVQTALSTVDKTPAMLAAMLNGDAGLDKARVVSDELAEVDDVAQARAIVDRLLPELSRVTTAQLRLRVRRLVLCVHPDKVRTRHTKSVEQRSVGHQQYANGTASLSGWYLSKDRAAAAWDHIDAIARATRTAGDPAGRGIDQIRADAFADLLAGVDPTLAGAATPAPRRGVIQLTVACPPWPAWMTNLATSPASDPSRPTWPARSPPTWPPPPHADTTTPSSAKPPAPQHPWNTNAPTSTPADQANSAADPGGNNDTCTPDRPGMEQSTQDSRACLSVPR